MCFGCGSTESSRNSLNAAVLAGMDKAVAAAAQDAGIRAIVLTAVGEKAFCAGANLSEGTATFQARAAEPTTVGRLARSVRAAGVPLIARVNGACVAGGMAVLGLCDLVIAAEHARFGLPEVKVGVFPMQVLVFLRSTMHARHINELCLTGELVSAQRAAEMGIVNEIAPAGELDSRVEALLAKIRLGSPAAIRRGKQAILTMEMLAFHEAIAFAEAQIALCASTADAQEGLQAFNEKRKPRWSNPED
jgi:methylglutaconyl-CoA hydratase